MVYLKSNHCESHVVSERAFLRDLHAPTVHEIARRRPPTRSGTTREAAPRCTAMPDRAPCYRQCGSARRSGTGGRAPKRLLGPAGSGQWQAARGVEPVIPIELDQPPARADIRQRTTPRRRDAGRDQLRVGNRHRGVDRPDVPAAWCFSRSSWSDKRCSPPLQTRVPRRSSLTPKRSLTASTSTLQAGSETFSTRSMRSATRPERRTRTRPRRDKPIDQGGR
jgi:hypothetical protein